MMSDADRCCLARKLQGRWFKSNPRNHFYRTIERNGNASPWKGEKLNDISGQLDHMAMGIITNGDAVNKPAQDLCCLCAGVWIAQRHVQVGHDRSVDLRQLWMEARRRWRCPVDEFLQLGLARLQLQQLFLEPGCAKTVSYRIIEPLQLSGDACQFGLVLDHTQLLDRILPVHLLVKGTCELLDK